MARFHNEHTLRRMLKEHRSRDRTGGSCVIGLISRDKTTGYLTFMGDCSQCGHKIAVFSEMPQGKCEFECKKCGKEYVFRL